MENSREQALYKQIVEKTWEDASFKANLIADPINTLEFLTGKKLDIPTGKKIVVRDQTDQRIVYINIPAKPDAVDVELNEDQLEAVAGGGFWEWLTGGSSGGFSGFGGGSFGGGGAGGSW